MLLKFFYITVEDCSARKSAIVEYMSSNLEESMCVGIFGYWK